MWLAPAGGRDRPNADDEWLPAPFDASAVELMRTLLGKAKRPGHLYPFAMSSWAIMPPPRVRPRPAPDTDLTFSLQACIVR